MRHLSKFIFFLTLAACSGEMHGVIRGEGTPVKFEYDQAMNHDVYRATIDDENFEGKAVPSNSHSAVLYTSSGPVFGTATSGSFVATLLGDHGSSLRCTMNYADSSGFTTAGGVGECQHSDGRMIDVLW